MWYLIFFFNCNLVRFFLSVMNFPPHSLFFKCSLIWFFFLSYEFSTLLFFKSSVIRIYTTSFSFSYEFFAALFLFILNIDSFHTKSWESCRSRKGVKIFSRLFLFPCSRKKKWKGWQTIFLKFQNFVKGVKFVANEMDNKTWRVKISK